MKCVGNTEQWKRSPIDARDAMLLQAPGPNALWHVVRAGDKRAVRLDLTRDGNRLTSEQVKASSSTTPAALCSLAHRANRQRSVQDSTDGCTNRLPTIVGYDTWLNRKSIARLASGLAISTGQYFLNRRRS